MRRRVKKVLANVQKAVAKSKTSAAAKKTASTSSAKSSSASSTKKTTTKKSNSSYSSSSSSSYGSSSSSSSSSSSDGTTVDTSTSTDTSTVTSSTDGTAETTAQNDPEKNKKLAEITIMESLREQYELTFEMPHCFKGLHTNRFVYMELNDDFYEKNYAEIIDKIKDTKFARYAGFQKGRFFVEKHEYGGGVDGAYTKIKVNPLANNYGTYMKKQQDAEKALISAMSGGSSSSGSSSNQNVTGEDCGADISTWATRSWGASSFESNSKTIIGNSSRTYAQTIASMTAEQAIKKMNHSYSRYYNNHTCPEKLMASYPNISCNCADYARLVKCICDVKGVQCAIYHGSNHYWNYVKINGNWESVDLCTNNNNRWDGYLRNTAGWQ